MKIRSQIDSYIADLKINKQDPAENEFQESLIEIIDPKKLENKPDTNREITFISTFQDWIKYRDSSIQYSKERVARYKSVLNHLIIYQSSIKNKISLEVLDYKFLEHFTTYLISNELKNTTITSIIKVVKTFLKDMKAIHKNITEEHFKTIKFTKDPEPPAIIFNEREIEIIESAVTENEKLNRTRDLLLVHIHTLLRVSDFKELNDFNINTDSKIITKYQVKTGDKVIIPIPEKIFKILEKYNFKLPMISEQKYNENLKELCKFLGFDELMEEASYSGTKRLILRKPKYEYITSHVARKTGITLLIKKGVPLKSIMKISGHKSIQTMMNYVRIAQDESVEIVRNAWEKRG